MKNNSTGLHYSDHLAVYACFQFDQNSNGNQRIFSDDFISKNEKYEELLGSACIIVEETIQRVRRERFQWFFVLIFFLAFFFSFNRNLWSTDSYLIILSIIIKDLFCLCFLSMGLWLVCLGKPNEHNALRSIQNAMYLRLRASKFLH